MSKPCCMCEIKEPVVYYAIRFKRETIILPICGKCFDDVVKKSNGDIVEGFLKIMGGRKNDRR